MITWMIALTMFVLGTVFFMQNLFFERFFAIGSGIGLPEDHIFFRFISTQHDEWNMTFFGMALLIIFSLVGAGIILSHRIAGPLYRLEKHLEGLGEGKKLTALKFRKNDYFQDLAQSYNQHMEKIFQKKN